jgi:hypothetical protein
MFSVRGSSRPEASSIEAEQDLAAVTVKIPILR